MTWEAGEPFIGTLYSQKLTEEFGPAREPDDQISERHQDLAASLQALYEEVFFHRLNWLQRRTGLKQLCLAGGCAMNSVGNGKIFLKTDFDDVFIQPAAGSVRVASGTASVT
jgi:carbamoyltransferase